MLRRVTQPPHIAGPLAVILTAILQYKPTLNNIIMKKLIILFNIFISFNSCEKSENELNTNFNKKILDGYFVTSIAFDSHGTAWIGTHKQGLIKYSSGNATYYNSSNSTFPDTSVIWDIEVDSKDNVWIGGDALTKYDGNSFTSFNSKNSKIPEDWIYCIAVDSKDNIWFTSCRSGKGGIVKYDGINWTVYTPANSILPVNYVKSIAIDKNDIIWLALQEKVNHAYLVKISNDDWSIISNKDLGFTPYWFCKIQCDSKNKLCGAIDYSLYWQSENPSGPQAFTYDGVNAIQLQFDTNSDIFTFTIDNNDHYWCTGLFYKSDNQILQTVIAIYNGNKWITDYITLKDKSIFCSEESLDNKIWIGTGDGIYINN